MCRFSARRKLSPLVMVVASMFLAIASASAADRDRINDLGRRLNDSATLIEALTRRVSELEHSPSSASAISTTISSDDSNRRLETVEQQVAQQAEAGASHSEHSDLMIHGFADVGAGTSAPTVPDLKGFSVGSLDLYLTPEIGDRTHALFELNFEVNESGQLSTDLERAQLGFAIGDTSTLWIGRFHTPYGRRPPSFE